ncbi:MAG TPA: hypothetical protein VGR84_11945, partial [Candidatus Acidoferrales bacterium]|nr:hypothetical protein [Candidatus Acidoferrales bacterium]
QRTVLRSSTDLMLDAMRELDEDALDEADKSPLPGDGQEHVDVAASTAAPQPPGDQVVPEESELERP